MSADPRSRAQRRRDPEHRLTHDIDVWVASSASADGALVPNLPAPHPGWRKVDEMLDRGLMHDGRRLV
ncbi:hypothetical protein [Streptomyces sp. KR80]|uniref:hypothetical protein n=1 Tax=Streptomyces sp. KR80 TaxID=3457426 RepID=UPI003FD48132